MIDILTGTAFDAPKRMNHREDELTAEFPSSVSSRRRGLLALKAINWIGGNMGDPYEIFNKFMRREKFDCIIPEGFTDCPNYFFSLFPLGKIVVPSTFSPGTGAQHGCQNMFEGCHAEYIEIKEGVTTLPSYFARTNDFTEVKLPNSVSTTARACFAYCYSLERVDIGTGATNIGEFFTQGASLKTLIVRAPTPPTITANTFFTARGYENFPIYVPDDSVDAYKAANVWSGYAERIHPLSELPA